ncbi:LafX [Aeromonas sp. BIGb0445]|jgi:hypothetical protein|uniref:LafX n=1 Tax=Aeromonas sp. BIGb0445 TaxID=2940593 RepID=UPI002169BDE4|nr:LafX [Aeromonas sp. BIGb0445]MCS3460309.1 hypothetical protein [Aeromonas sp. BIGb0445]
MPVKKPSIPGIEYETRQRQLLALGRQLQQQAQAGQWDAVRLTDQRLAQFCCALANSPSLWQALQPVRQQVKAWHGEALAQCRAELETRQQEWQRLSQGREGMQAYDEVQSWL